ncbi:uncharacterized protein LOC119399111 [Rhipicephalus sanguineus]|uniref:uncharacterized protein LOC119399111 n=1 Tax=Rhipicephalus sanguineus TaxID=34632 RepID=UPI0020C3E027|nr:uncharacterized protein LOC119399111 [Rhipicephalus sanguineus]
MKSRVLAHEVSGPPSMIAGGSEEVHPQISGESRGDTEESAMDESSMASAMDEASTASDADATDVSDDDVSTAPNEDGDDDYPDEAIPIVACCITCLLIVMIILLPLISSLSATDLNDDDDGNFTLICVFEYITWDIWNKTDQCTDYVYIRAYYYAVNVNHEPLVFTRKTLKRRTHILYYDDPMYWYNLGMADFAVNFVQRLRYAHADWYLGMWGATFVRLLTSLWDTNIVRDSLYELTHRTMFGPINSSRFDGFAIINSIIKDMRGAFKVEQQYNERIFKGTSHPIIRPGWTYLHTAAVWPGGEDVVTDRHVRNLLSVADIVGLSTSNTTDEPNTVQFVGASPRFLWASPPNPIRGIYPGIRGMLDMLREFPNYKRLLNQDRICFSISSSINYARNLYRNIDFRMEMEDMDGSVLRYTRYRFTSIDNHTNQYPLDSDNFKYEFNDTTYTHFWSLRVGGNLKGFFAYDDASTIAHKMSELLKAYPVDRCVVFDDLGDDMWEANFKHDGRTISFKKYEMLHAVSSAMVKRYGRAFPSKYY